MPQYQRIERLTHALAQRINSGIKSRADALSDGPPPFSIKLSEDEMLQQYFAMDQQKTDQLIETEGMAAYNEYSLAMQRLLDKRGLLNPSNVGGYGSPETGPANPPLEPSLDGKLFAQASGQEAPDPEHDPHAIMNQVLQSVGVNING